MIKKYDVDIDLANETKKEMAKTLATDDKRDLNRVGAFASLYDINYNEYTEPVLVLKTEEPGSKQIVAFKYDKIENVCFDMINHLVNDCIVMGAKPLTVQDAIICGKMDKEIVSRIVKAIFEACKRQGCVLTGGETSEQPNVIGKNTYILTSSIVGIVEKQNIIDGAAIEEGDVIIGLESSGIHTNGYTLVRKIMEENPEIMNEYVEGKTFIETILEPHRCYYTALKTLFEKPKMIHGLAHITGGGICENLNRILPVHLDAKIDLNSYRVLEIFKVLKKYGNIANEEMLRTFNLGVGMALVTSKGCMTDVIKHIQSQDIACTVIGEIVKGNQKVICTGELRW